jgi:hypothetical protein
VGQAGRRLARHPGAQHPGHAAGHALGRAARRRARHAALGGPAGGRGPGAALRAVRPVDLGAAAGLPALPRLRVLVAGCRACRDRLLVDPHLAAVRPRTLRARSVRRRARGAALGWRAPATGGAAGRRRRQRADRPGGAGRDRSGPDPGGWPVLRWRRG